MITGSHNPPEYNGFKMSIGKETIHGDRIQSIRSLTEQGDFLEGEGSISRHPVLPDYIAWQKKHFPDLSGIRVVLDCGNGTGGLAAPEIMEGLGADVVRLFCEPDGNFPNHHPDPVVTENLRDLIRTVRESGAHLGIGYDGDADRLGVVSSDGEIIWGDRLMIIFSRRILKDRPGSTVIGEVKCSQVMYDDIRARGGEPVMWKTGHSLIKGKMKETKALLAGEMSGHIFFADRYFGFDDAIYASLRLLEIMKENGPPYDLKRLLSGLPEVCSTPEIRFDCDDGLKFHVIEKLQDAFAGLTVNTTDGARVLFEDGWALVRASNTQPALVMRFEARTEDSLRQMRSFIEEKLQEVLRQLA